MLNHANAVKWAVAVASVETAATGLVLIISPPLFGRLIFGAEFSAAGEALGRLTGIALLGFALTTWPAPAVKSCSLSAQSALLVYNVLATIYLAYLGLTSNLAGILFWPAVGLHLVLTALLAWASAAERATNT